MKNARINLRISSEDLEKIRDKAKQSNKTLTDYVTTVCLGKEIIVIPNLYEVLKQQKALGRNLNQLVTLANMGRVTVVYLDETIGELTAINQSLQGILQRKRW
ncbi:MAG TPA: plasmid mobilization relaxosome protein MobC [Lachnospiraceae bacterium]|nr:plasmid mobilization relaxosome protein MobC [Lachnospiraceae bacterium]